MDAEQIAKGLSEAQKRAVCWPHRSDAIPIIIWSYTSTMRVLERLGLLGQRHGGWFELSTLGLAVRAILESRND